MSDPDAPADEAAPAISSPSSKGAVAPERWPPPPLTRWRGRIWTKVLLGVVGLVVIAALIASRISVNYYVITPGDATPVSQYIEVPPQNAHPLTGKILLTDVFVTQLNALSYLQYSVFDSDSQVVPGASLLEGSANEEQYLAQGYLQMAQAQSFATAAALSHLGHRVTAANAGAQIYGIEPGSPAAKSLQVAQVITGVNGTPTTTVCDFVQALRGKTPGTSVSLSVEQSSINNVGDVVPGAVVQKAVTLGPPPKGLLEKGCGPPFKPTAFLGVTPEQQLDWHFPVKVTVHTQDIGGPSAGLAMTLGIIDKLTSGRLTGHRIVAATGTMDPYGNVGDVGGVAEKTIAVERAGATVFFVPRVELKTAESKATPQLHVYAVKNLDQVLRILERLGGTVPAAGTTTPVSIQAAP